MLRYCIGGIRYSKNQSYMQRTPAKFSAIRMASGKAMIMDSAYNANDPDIISGVDSTSEGSEGSFQVYNSGKNMSTSRHQGSANTVFADGHVRNVSRAELQVNTSGDTSKYKNNVLLWHGGI